MTREHIPITSYRVIKQYSYNDVFLFYKGKFVGEGGFEVVSRKKGWLHTEGVSLQKEHRKKGHGIHIYHHLISTAIRIGCTRLYSSISLNKFSRRMWGEKLSKFYKVVPVKTKATCNSCGSKHPRILKYYIDLKKA